uniref:Uncharacterized protein n=1 Tax=Solanum tuberosum TaxID=4113 RepID=M1DMH4_SOLTU
MRVQHGQHTHPQSVDGTPKLLSKYSLSRSVEVKKKKKRREDASVSPLIQAFFRALIQVVKKYAAKDHSAQLVGIADPLSDPPFGLVHRLSALSFNNFKFCNIGRWSTASRHHSATRRLLFYLTDLIFFFRAWHTGTLGETIAIWRLA